MTVNLFGFWRVRAWHLDETHGKSYFIVIYNESGHIQSRWERVREDTRGCACKLVKSNRSY